MCCRFEPSKTSSISARESPSHCDAAPASGYFPASSSCQRLRGGAAPHAPPHHRQGRHYHFTGTRNYTQPSVDFYKSHASDDFGKMSRIAREWMFAQRPNLSCCCQANTQFRGLRFFSSQTGGVCLCSQARNLLQSTCYRSLCVGMCVCVFVCGCIKYGHQLHNCTCLHSGLRGCGHTAAQK